MLTSPQLTTSIRKPPPLNFSTFFEENSRNLDEQVHGGFTIVVTGGAVSFGVPLNWTHGLGKIVFSVNAAPVVAGTLQISGTRVDRNTGVETPGFTEDIDIVALTTDNSTTDAQGNVIHNYDGAYISSNWYKGSVTLTSLTAGQNITDIDVWNIAFEQVNDRPFLQLKTFNVSMYCTNTAGWFYGYLYLITLDPSTKIAQIFSPAALELPVGDTTADRRYRLRKGMLDQQIDGTHEGFWVELHFGPPALSYWRDISLDVWFEIS